MDKRLAQRFGVGIGIAAVVYLVMAVYADWGELRAAVAGFHWSLALPVLGLSLLNYFVRFLRWELYLRRSEVRLETWLSMRIFLCGLVMSVTPGKFGELLKAYLVKMHSGVPVSRTGPIVVAERATDLLALFVLIFVGSLLYHTGYSTLVASGAVAFLMVVALTSPRIALVVLGLVERLPLLRRYGERLERAYESMRSLMRPGVLVGATALGVVAWFAECVGFALVLRGFDVDLSVGFATFVYASATLIGALVLAPGGLGGTEGSMVAMLVTAGAAKEIAVAATFLVRIATLWFAVLLGASVLLIDPRLTVRTDEIESNDAP